MKSQWKWNPLRRVVCVLFFMSFLCETAAGGEAMQGNAAASPSHDKKKIHLQLRIAKAQRKADSLRYYQSVARQLKTGKVAIPANRRR